MNSMSKSRSLRRLVENEVYFRQMNRNIEKQFSHLKKLASEHGQSDMIDDDDMMLQFFCECSDEACRSRISLRRSQYDKIHKADDTFVIVRGHEVPEVERVLRKTADYYVVVKKIEPPKASSGLNSTPVANA